MNNVNVRYGPSPTGIPHVGNIRTALFNYLFAKNQNGKFFLRIEDTDQARIVDGAVEKIQQSLKLLGILWDGEIIFQSKRLDLYQKYLNVLKESNLVYEEEGAWRFKIDTSIEKMTWPDAVHGEITFPTKVIEDFIIVKSDGFPTYHFASVVDDHEMEISHVFRGDEWISSTPKHLQLYKAFGWEPPVFVHLPVILGTNKKKLSKRDGAKSVKEFVDEGYLPEALVNFLVLLGWAPKTNQEVFSLSELTKVFSLDRINKNSPIFNLDKLDWFNAQWLSKMSDDELTSLIKKENQNYDTSLIKQVLPITKDRMNKISDFKEIADLFFTKPDLKLNLKNIKISKKIFSDVISALETIKNWDDATITKAVVEIMELNNLSKAEMYRSLGISISGKLVTPPIFKSMEVLTKEESINRLKNAAEKI